jgi:beta-N-acetylhexosaminidase
MVATMLRTARPVLCAVLVALLAGCTSPSPAPRSSAPGASGSPAGSPSPSPSSGPSLPAMTARQLAGQRIIYSYPGLTPPASLLQHIRDGEAAGVIFFGDNISGTAQITSVIQQLRQAQRQSPIHAPLLLMTDQEGGKIRRLPGEPVLSAKQIGQSSNPSSQASRAGEAAAANLTGVGMNVNLAPVLDVYYAANDFIDQFDRSYSSSANTVAGLGKEFITAQQSGGVAATAKHFPGLGAAGHGQNTDLEPVTVNTSLSGLRGKDEVPYSAAIAAGVKLVMVSWAVYPALDPAHPGGLSQNVVGSELRGRLHYSGVTITDGLEAGALRSFGTPGQRATLAAQAGMDLILCAARSVPQGENAAAGLAAGLTNGQLDPAGFNASVERVMALRTGLS